MVINKAIRTGVTFNPSQGLKKNSQEEARIMTDKEQYKQKKVLLNLVRVRKTNKQRNKTSLL